MIYMYNSTHENFIQCWRLYVTTGLPVDPTVRNIRTCDVLVVGDIRANLFDSPRHFDEKDQSC